jgi:nitrate/TMAO reductase-like tetraheme cytochrome c subunit
VSKLAFQREKKNPIKRFKLLVFGLIGFIAILASGYGINSFTSSPSFCSSCHEMTPEYVTYSETAHNQIKCVDCHDKPGIKNIIPNKLNLAKEVYSHYKGIIPEQILQTKDELISSQNCLKCHSKNRLITATGDLKVNHPGHVKEGIPCITCHEGVVHAKIAARELNMAEDRDKWTRTNAEKLIAEKYSEPNMGTCIDCHDKVNKGQKPWEDTGYFMPPNTQKINNNSTAANDENNEIAQNQKTQELILQAIGKQKRNVKISMECKTCHKIVKVPLLHKHLDWPVNHGSTAIQQLDKCLNCHQDSKWIKRVPKEDIMTLIEMSKQKVKYTPNYELVKVESRTNKFCRTCHSSKPPSHTQSNWAPGHAVAAADDSEKLKCFICHDENETPNVGPTSVKAPAQSCQHCHKYFE